MNFNRTIFIGMMGSGKTTISKLYAKEKGMSVFDMDSLFEEKFKTSIRDYFKNFGEENFRKEEGKILSDILKKDNFVLSTGGGIILKKENRDIIFGEKNTVIYLKTSYDVIYDRIKNDITRPLLLVQNPKEEIKKLIEEREKYYIMADIEILCDNKTPDEIIDEIKKYERN